MNSEKQKIIFTHTSDEHDCEDCGTSYCKSWQVSMGDFVAGKTASAYCFGAEEYGFLDCARLLLQHIGIDFQYIETDRKGIDQLTIPLTIPNNTVVYVYIDDAAYLYENGVIVGETSDQIHLYAAGFDIGDDFSKQQTVTTDVESLFLPFLNHLGYEVEIVIDNTDHCNDD